MMNGMAGLATFLLPASFLAVAMTLQSYIVPG